MLTEGFSVNVDAYPTLNYLILDHTEHTHDCCSKNIIGLRWLGLQPTY